MASALEIEVFCPFSRVDFAAVSVGALPFSQHRDLAVDGLILTAKGVSIAFGLFFGSNNTVVQGVVSSSRRHYPCVYTVHTKTKYANNFGINNITTENNNVNK